MQARSGAVLAELGCPLDPAAPVRSLTVAQRQMVEIAKAVSRDVRVLIMDEPTAVLTGTEASVLARFIRKLAARGAAIAYISHKLDEALALADEVTVLRDGALVATRPAAGLTANAVARLMVGRDVSDLFLPKAPPGMRTRHPRCRCAASRSRAGCRTHRSSCAAARSWASPGWSAPDGQS